MWNSSTQWRNPHRKLKMRTLGRTVHLQGSHYGVCLRPDNGTRVRTLQEERLHKYPCNSKELIQRAAKDCFRCSLVFNRQGFIYFICLFCFNFSPKPLCFITFVVWELLKCGFLPCHKGILRSPVQLEISCLFQSLSWRQRVL